jgi:uncharacterized protein DUF1566
MRSRSRRSHFFVRVSMLGVLATGVFTLWGTSPDGFAASSSNQHSTTDVPDLLLQNWSKKLPSPSRFTVLAEFGNAAVRDDETGLVWEKTLETSEASWSDARAACADKDVGGRKGWRLPSISELASLVDPSMKTGSTLPLGHPFTNAQADVYWSATTMAGNPNSAWLVFFDTGKVTYAFKTITFHVWCVRGGINADQY